MNCNLCQRKINENTISYTFTDDSDNQECIICANCLDKGSIFIYRKEINKVERFPADIKPSIYQYCTLSASDDSGFSINWDENGASFIFMFEEDYKNIVNIYKTSNESFPAIYTNSSIRSL